MISVGRCVSTFDFASVSGGSGTLTGRALRGYDEYCAAAELYVNVFQYDASKFALNPNLLSALAHNGGSAVGVFEPGLGLVGFAYGFAAKDEFGADFQYSQAAIVHPRFQGRGVGRMLKQLQADVARGWGHDRMRWTFDPMLTKNAHFNFNSLGATGIRFMPDYYERRDTNRILVEWALSPKPEHGAAPRRIDPYLPAPSFETSEAGVVKPGIGNSLWVGVPRHTSAANEAAAVATTLTETLEAGYVLAGCSHINDDMAAYLAVPAPEGERHD